MKEHFSESSLNTLKIHEFKIKLLSIKNTVQSYKKYLDSFASSYEQKTGPLNLSEISSSILNWLNEYEFIEV